MPPYPLTNFEIHKYYQNEPNLNGAYSRNNLSKIKDGAYIINLNEYESIGAHLIVLYVNAKNVISLIILELNIFQKNLENSLEKNILQWNLHKADTLQTGHLHKTDSMRRNGLLCFAVKLS